MPLVGRKAVGIENRLPALTLANASACGKRLFESQPVLRRKSTACDRPPQDKDIDARIWPPRNRIAGKPRHGRCRTPRLRPRENPRFKLRDDFGGHLLIKRDAQGIAPARGAKRRLPAPTASPSFAFTNCHDSLHTPKNPPQPAPEEAGWAARSDQRGAWRAGHTRRAATKRKTPSGVVSRGAMTLGGSAAHPVSFRSRHKQRRCARAVHSKPARAAFA